MAARASSPISSSAARGAGARAVWARRARVRRALGAGAPHVPPPARVHARAAVPRAVCGERGAAARTYEVQLGAALADLLQRLSDRANLNHVSRPAELARLTATPCCAAAAPWPAQRSRIGGVQANAPLAEAGHLAIRCVRRSTAPMCTVGATPISRGALRQAAAERILMSGAVRGVQRCRELHRQACTRAAPKRGVQSSVERHRAMEERCCTARGAEWCGRCQFEALRGSSGGDAEAWDQAQGRVPARWL